MGRHWMDSRAAVDTFFTAERTGTPKLDHSTYSPVIILTDLFRFLKVSKSRPYQCIISVYHMDALATKSTVKEELRTHKACNMLNSKFKCM
jgi:hypothetical protein